MIFFKAVEYPTEKILDLKDLTDLVLQELEEQIEDFKSEVETEFSLREKGED